MKIAVMGTFTQANLEIFLAQAFRDLGHEVAMFDAWGLKSSYGIFTGEPTARATKVFFGRA